MNRFAAAYPDNPLAWNLEGQRYLLGGIGGGIAQFTEQHLTGTYWRAITTGRLIADGLFPRRELNEALANGEYISPLAVEKAAQAECRKDKPDVKRFRLAGIRYGYSDVLNERNDNAVTCPCGQVTSLELDDPVFCEFHGTCCTAKCHADFCRDFVFCAQAGRD